MSAFQAPTGTRDILAPESAYWQSIIAKFARGARRAGYGLVISPMFEDIGVFRRGVGESTEVVQKEMYEFEDKGGRTLALRPEGTAPVVRAFVQHHPQIPWKTWYATPGFRYERPQAGRYRQFHQLGVEVLGSDDPDLDVEVIALAYSFLESVGLRDFVLKVNSMGDGNCLPGYTAELASYLEERASQLCPEHEAHWKNNPLRVLDCKKDPCMQVKVDAPKLSGALCEPCTIHFARVTEGLDALKIAWTRDEYLVRGLDYYQRTTFEVAPKDPTTAQNALLGGGRYDGLVESLGGKPTPGVGFAAGIERIVAAALADGLFDEASVGVDVFVVDLTGGGEARDITHELRAAGISADRAFDGRSMKAQFRLADRSGARLAVIVGANELAAQSVSLRDLRGVGELRQESVMRGNLVSYLSEVLS